VAASKSVEVAYERLKRGQVLMHRVALLCSSDAGLDEDFGALTHAIEEYFGDAAVACAVSDAPNTTSPAHGALVIPVAFSGRPVGSIVLRSENATPIDEDDVTVLETVALQLGARIHATRQVEIESTFRRLATADALTGLANRRSFDEALMHEWRRCARSGSMLGLAMLDVDFFKRYNDAYGHVAGDACLKQVAQAIAKCAKRPGDVAARYGGEEFAVILPDCDPHGLLSICQSICEAVRSLSLAHEGSSLGYVSVSVGGAALVPDAAAAAESLIKAADAQLYAAKTGGRNRVAREDYSSDAPAVRPHAVVRHNLPRYTTLMVGRDRECADLIALLRESALVTIAGTGGLGKTRLAVQIAGNLVDDFDDGVWFVDLSRIFDRTSIYTAAAGAVGLQLSPAQDPESALFNLLAPQQLLVVLDNCEHIVDEAARFAERLMQQCPGATVLATSREALGVRGETIYRLETLDDASALTLFIDRARRIDQRFALAESDVPVVTDICRQLDGIALAIELAAARVHVLPPQQLLTHLRQRLGSPVSDDSVVSPRHATIGALIDWSFKLLSDDERKVFRRLGVFSGSFTLEAARSVVADANAEPSQALDAFFALVDKSLLVTLPGAVQRFRMLDPIQAYALNALQEAGDLHAARVAHATHFATFSGETTRSYGTTSEELWLARFEPDLDNFRAAYDWAISAQPRLAATIAGNVGELWYYGGLLNEGRTRCEAALAALDDESRDRPEAAQIWLTVARMAWEAREVQRCIAAGHRAHAIASRSGSSQEIARALYTTGRARFLGRSDTQRGLDELREAVARFRVEGSPARAAVAMSMYGYALATGEGNLAEGRALQEEGLDIARLAGLAHLAFTIETSLSETEFAAGELALAIHRSRQVVGALSRRRLPFLRIVALGNLASYLGVAEEYEEAATAARESVELARAYELTSRIPARIQAAALAEAARGDAARAARLLGFVDASYEQRGVARERTETIVRGHVTSVLEARLAADTIAQEIAAGRLLSLDAACALALA
jgi:diguanylate cyclase (GGDEF)-like protein